MDWNDRYRNDDTPWDKGTATPVMDEILARHRGVFSGRAIVPGCGAGHDARALAAAGCKALGVDIAPLAVDRARALDPEGRADYVVADFIVADFIAGGSAFAGAFDLVWEHTCFCAIPPELRKPYLRAAANALKPGGALAGVFFIEPEMAPGESGPPFGVGVPELRAMLAEAGFAVVDAWVPATGYPGRVGRELALVATR